MISIYLNVDPVPWSAPKLSKYGTYDPKEAEKRATRFLIRQQYTGVPYTGYFNLSFTFIFAVPKSYSKKKRDLIERGLLVPTRSDLTNLQKFYEDCLKNIVIDDDRGVAYITSSKLYGKKGQVLITVTPWE
jgi:Holliday junction resolvase RusA-like endonuclease